MAQLVAGNGDPCSGGIHDIVEEFTRCVQLDALSPRNAANVNIMYLPSQAKVEQIVSCARKIIFPGMFADFQISTDNMKYHIGMVINEVKQLLLDQIERALSYQAGNVGSFPVSKVKQLTQEKTAKFLQRLPHIRAVLLLDVESSMRGDPAAKSPEEIMLCYPGIEAVMVHRVAHELYVLEVPLIPRMMSAYAHRRTAIDIHPGAQIGSSFFIDHGTGVVIGETTIIGNNVKMFHGVTLGALSTKDGQALAGKKRHPTIEDDVTLYAGAVILGGLTVVGKGATIGGSVFITKSVPAGYVVTGINPELHMRRHNVGKDYECFDPCI